MYVIEILYVPNLYIRAAYNNFVNLFRQINKSSIEPCIVIKIL